MEPNALELRHRHPALSQNGVIPLLMYPPTTRRNKSPQSMEMGLAGSELLLEASSIKNRRKRRTRATRRPRRPRIVARKEQTGAKEMVSGLITPLIAANYSQLKQNPTMKLDLRPRLPRPNPSLHRQALIPPHPKNLLLHDHQLVSLADHLLDVVALVETNIPKTGTRTAMGMLVIWQTHRAEATRTRLAEIPPVLDTG